MAVFEGNLSKMKTELASPVQYTLFMQETPVAMNELIGHTVQLRFGGRINCVNCNRLTKKSYGQGFCYPCFINSPQNSECIIRPELCRAHLGEGRDVAWEKANHLQPHIVYLAQTDAVKVGVTRTTQVPTRWIDQGARKAVPIVEVPYRYLAGKAEVALKNHFTDKTNWRNMLRDHKGTDDLQAHARQIVTQLPDELKEFCCTSFPVVDIQYPVKTYPAKVTSITLDKHPEFTGMLTGIRGQYLMFEDGRVMNIRNHSGYYVQLSV